MTFDFSGRGRGLRGFYVDVEDFPYGSAGQNSGHHWREKADERRRNRMMGKMVAVDAMARFPHMGRLEGPCHMTVDAYSPMDDAHVHDTINLPAMLKGYFDGFTDAGVWEDDRQVRSLEVVQHSGEYTRQVYPRGFLIFSIREVLDSAKNQ